MTKKNHKKKQANRPSAMRFPSLAWATPANVAAELASVQPIDPAVAKAGYDALATLAPSQGRCFMGLPVSVWNRAPEDKQT